MTGFLTFTDVTMPDLKTKKFMVYSAHTEDYLGYIAWDTGWRRYVMNFESECKWSIECLAECYKFMAKLMQERKGRGVRA